MALSPLEILPFPVTVGVPLFALAGVRLPDSIISKPSILLVIPLIFLDIKCGFTLYPFFYLFVVRNDNFLCIH